MKTSKYYNGKMQEKGEERFDESDRVESVKTFKYLHCAKHPDTAFPPNDNTQGQVVTRLTAVSVLTGKHR